MWRCNFTKEKPQTENIKLKPLESQEEDENEGWEGRARREGGGGWIQTSSYNQLINGNSILLLSNSFILEFLIVSNYSELSEYRR